MTREQLEDVVVGVLTRIAPEASPATIDRNANLQDALDIDSIDFLNFVMGLHEATGVDVPERDYPKITTVNDCVAYLLAHGA